MDIKQIPCDSRNYRARRGTGKIEYIVMHYTGNNGDTDEGNGNYFAGRDTNDTSAHYFVDEDSVTQSVQDNFCAFHCGGTSYIHPKCRNDNSIGIEMCSDKDENGKFIITAKTVDNTVELTKIKMKQYGVGIDKVLRHHDITGKSCPEPWVRDEVKWNNFKKRLMNDLNGDEDMKTPAKIVVNGKELQGYILADNLSYAPVRALAEALGAKVGWDDKTKTVTITK